MRCILKNLLLAFPVVRLLLALPAYAAPTFSVRPSGFYDTPTDYINLLDAVINWFFYFITLIAIVLLLWAAYTYLTAGDDEERIKKAKSIIIYALIALAIALVAAGIPQLIQTFLGV